MSFNDETQAEREDEFASVARLATEYADASDEAAEVEIDADEVEITIPENFESTTDEDLAALHSTAVDAFNALYGADGSALTTEALGALSVLTDGIERVTTELEARKEAQALRAQEAQALASRAGVTLASEADAEDEEKAKEEEDEETLATDSDAPAVALAADAESTATETLAVEDAETLTASAPGPIRINLAGLRPTRAATQSLAEEPESTGTFSTMTDVVKVAPEFASQAERKPNSGLDWAGIGRGLDRRLAQFNVTQYAKAADAGRSLRSQQPMIVLQKPIPEELRLKSDDTKSIDAMLRLAADESRLQGNSLVAAGGWCAPSETLYDLCEIETRDGIFSLPEIGISRGGINYTAGPNFAEIFANTGFSYTEEEDIDGDYDGTGGGSKPCYTVPCPPFTETRLAYDGVCINAGLLMQRGYPEVIARTTRGALVAHDHKMAGNILAAVQAGSTAVTMTAGQVGTTAPVLDAIELQVEHFRTVNRASRSQSLEAVFPFWIRGAIRSDLARRLGVDLFDVSDERIAGWFRDRGIAPQFVYNWNDLTGAAGSFVQWPTTVKFLLYGAGTWVRGTSEIITLDTLYDSTLLGTNDYTALFSEEGWLVAKTCHDSRVVTVPVCSTGMTGGGLEIACNGTAVPPPTP